MPMNAESIIKTNFLQTKWRADEERKKEAQNRLDLYSDDYEDIIREVMSQLFHKDNFKRLYYHVNGSQNVLKRVVNEISSVYKTQAQRELKTTNERYEELKEGLKLDTVMKRVNRYANLMNECLIKVGVRYTNGKPQMVLDILTPNICTVIQNEDDPTKADAIIYMRTWVNTVGKTDIDYHLWSVEGDYWIFDKEFRITRKIYTGDSPYKDREGNFIIPIPIVHRQEPDSAFWDQDSGRDLYNASVLTGIKMTLFDYYFKAASFKQPYVVSDDFSKVPQDQVLDPLTVFQVSGQGAQVGLLDMQISLDQLRDALVYQINSVVNNYGISADQWTLSIAEVSGRALKIRNRALLEMREEQLPTYHQAEQELFEIMRIVNNAHFKEKIPEKAELEVDFAEIDFPEDPREELDIASRQMRAGLISLGQFYQKFNPDIDDEKEAEKIILENLKKLMELKEANPDIDEMLDKLLGTVIEKKKKPDEEEEEGEEMEE